MSRNAPFDAYVAGTGDISLKASGLRLFVGKAAAPLPQRFLLHRSKVHNLGIPQIGIRPAPIKADSSPSRNCRAPVQSQRSLQRRSQRGLARRITADDPADLGRSAPFAAKRHPSAPYMHTGGFADLRDVISFYTAGRRHRFHWTKDPRNQAPGLTAPEIDELIEFIDTLTGEALSGSSPALPQLPP